MKLAVPLLCLWAWPATSLACSCLKDPSPPEQQIRKALSDAEYVALIKVKSVGDRTLIFPEYYSEWNPRTQQTESKERIVDLDLRVADFEAERVYKGDPSIVLLETLADPARCGVTFEPGTRYLVYARFGDEEDRVSTSLCDRTTPAENAAEEMEILAAMTRPTSVVFQATGAERRFNETLDLIHVTIVEPDFEAISRALTIAEELARSDPFSGYSQTLKAEQLSTWELMDRSKQPELEQKILTLIDEALRINPRLAQAHVARARTYMRAAKPDEAQAEIQSALRLSPQLPAALFVQAEIYFRLNDSAKASSWMRDYIKTVQDPLQKANGYDWLGNMRRDYAYHPQAVNRQSNLNMAGAYYLTAIQLIPNDAGRLVNYSAFLNEHTADFAGAERAATQALALEESESAHYQLAAARYQALQAKAGDMDVESLRKWIAEIEAGTGVSLDKAAEFRGFRDIVKVRLMRLQAQVVQ